MRRWIWRFIVAFRTNNNVRLAVLWGITGFLLVFNLFVFGVGPVSKLTVGETAQRYNNLYYFGQFVTDAELHPLSSFLESFFGGIWDSFRSVAWWLWFGLLLLSIVYTPIAFRDEVARAWEIAWRKARERRGGEETANLPPLGNPPSTPASPQSTQQPTERPLGFRRYLIWEVITDFASAFLSHAFMRR